MAPMIIGWYCCMDRVSSASRVSTAVPTSGPMK